MFDKWIINHNRTDLDHYKNLKRALGVMGILLPFVLMIGGALFGGYDVQKSVSHYYHTNMQDMLVGVLAAVSIFLVTYSGYGFIDSIVTTLTGVAGTGVILFPSPTDPMVPLAPVGIFQVPQEVSGTPHLICAGAFFFLLAVNSLFLFTVTDPQKWGPKKLLRNVVYIVCGVVMLACLATLLIIVLAAPDFLASTRIGLIFETIMLFAFGVSWLVKGNVPFFRDKKTA